MRHVFFSLSACNYYIVIKSSKNIHINFNPSVFIFIVWFTLFFPAPNEIKKYTFLDPVLLILLVYIYVFYFYKKTRSVTYNKHKKSKNLWATQTVLGNKNNVKALTFYRHNDLCVYATMECLFFSLSVRFVS